MLNNVEREKLKTSPAVTATPESDQGRVSRRASGLLLLASLVVGFGLFLMKQDFAATCDAAFHLRYSRDLFLAILDGAGYPDWDALPFDGRGTAAFRYYAPLPYLVAGVLQILGLGPVTAVKGTMLLFAMIAAWGVRSWFGTLRREADGVAAAAILLCSPILTFHLFYVFLFQNLCAMCLLPWLLAAMNRYWREEHAGFAKAGIAFGCMFLTHLPSALIAGYTLLLLGLLEFWKQRRILPLVRLGLVAAVGLLLAAPYVLPSMLTLSHIHFQRGMVSLAPGTGTECLDDPFLTTAHRRISGWEALGQLASLCRQRCLGQATMPTSAADESAPKLANDNQLYPFTQVRPWLWFCWLSMILAVVPGAVLSYRREHWWPGMIGMILLVLSLRMTNPLFSVLPGLSVLQFAWRLLLPAHVLLLPWMVCIAADLRTRRLAVLALCPAVLLTVGMQLVSGTFTPPMVESFFRVPAYPWEYLPTACPDPERLSPLAGKPHRLQPSSAITNLEELERGFESLVFRAEVASGGGELFIQTHFDPGWMLCVGDEETPLDGGGACGTMRARLPGGRIVCRLTRRAPAGRWAGWLGMLLGAGWLFVASRREMRPADVA